jgi:CubicO group peptidase (beta-lactamase class C family)
MRLLAAFALLSIAAFAPAATPPPAAVGLPRSTPEAQGVSSRAVLGFVAAAEEKIKSLHSFMLIRHGHVVAEGWWAPYAAAEPHELYSLSKSFTSTAVGFAVTEGRLSIDDPVLKFFPDEAPAKPSANLRALRVRDLLTMSTGHHNEDIQGFPYNDPDSVVRRFLALPVTHKPGTFFVYNTPGSYMLSAIVQKVTGQSVLEYLRPRLFEPLGIEHPTWDASPQGVSLGGFGLSIRTEDIARFGQFYLQRGQWQGRQLLPASWVATATSRWMSNGSAPTSDWEQGYGFQFWRCRNGVFRGDGAHGQFCLVFPDDDAVLALTAGTRDLQGVLNVVWAELLPALRANRGPLAADEAAQVELRRKTASLSLTPFATLAPPPLAATVGGRRYVFPHNSQQFEALSLSPAAGEPGATEITLVSAGTPQRIVVRPGRWDRRDDGVGTAGGPIATTGGWTGADTYTWDVVRYRTPFTYRLTMRFDGDTVSVTAQPNVGPASAAVTLVGRRE